MANFLPPKENLPARRVESTIAHAMSDPGTPRTEKIV